MGTIQLQTKIPGPKSRELSARRDAAVPRGKIIDPAVTNMAEVHPPRREPAETQRRLHAFAFLVTAAEIRECAMNFREEFRQ